MYGISNITFVLELGREKFIINWKKIGRLLRLDREYVSYLRVNVQFILSFLCKRICNEVLHKILVITTNEPLF
jgi:hypothetical protein